MSWGDLVLFIALAGIAAYVQTLTGFAFGLIMMGAIALFRILPLPEAAVFVGLLTLTNAAQMLLKGWRHVARRELSLILLTSLPTLVGGYFLLEWLADTRLDALSLALGIVVMLSSLQLVMKPVPRERPSPDWTFPAFGVVSGLMGGLFSTGGPPLVYHLYRQPWPVATIRESLVAAFAIAATLRFSTVVASGNMPPAADFTALLAVPMVSLATYAVRRWPPPITTVTMRRIVFVLLFFSGISLAGPALVHMIGVRS